ncbi:unnamed protein product, partial [Rotaria sp. Silwood2]
MDLVLWHCNNGIHVRSSDGSSDFYCLCPPEYYGDRCQFQRKRLIFTLQVQMEGAFENLPLTFKIAVLLVRGSIPSTIISHDQFVYLPHHYCLPKYDTQLLYLINESSLSLSSSSINHSVHIHLYNGQTLEHHAWWYFPVPFEYLPVNRMAKRVIVTTFPVASEFSQKKFHNTNCTSCSNNAVCLGYDIDLDQDICVCFSNFTGRRCLIPFEVCTAESCNGHGKCIPSDAHFNLYDQFMCLCDKEWMGSSCEFQAPVINVTFGASVSITSLELAIIQFIGIRDDSDSGPNVYAELLPIKEKPSNLTLSLYNLALNTEQAGGLYLIFVHLYESHEKVDYYFKGLHNPGYSSTSNTNIEINLSDTCRSIHDLFNSTVLAQPQLQRVKSYQRLCIERQHRNQLICFYDEKFMCLCNQKNRTECFNYDRTSYKCRWNKCSDRGLCIQDHEFCPKKSWCLCKPCSYGFACQFSTAGYTLSLDAIVGLYIQPTVTNILHQSSVIQITVGILCTIAVIGIIINVLAIGTFAQRATQSIGSIHYLFVSSLFGLFTMIVLIFKMMLLVQNKQNNFSCSFLEFLLKWLPTSSDWLNACVAIERTLVVI